MPALVRIGEIWLELSVIGTGVFVLVRGRGKFWR